MTNLLKFDKVAFRPHKNLTIAQDLSFEVRAGDFIVIIGGNGSGKSTLIKLINGTYRRSAGEITLAGKPLETYDKRELARRIVTLSQFVRDSLFVKLTVVENARLLDMTYGRHGGSKQLTQALGDYLNDFRDGLDRTLDRPLHLLSGGEQQIVVFALYLRHRPELLLLDEHTSALDPKTGDKLMQLTGRVIRKRGITCLMTCHHLDFALQYGNRLMAIKGGRIIFHADGEDKSKLHKQSLLEMCY